MASSGSSGSSASSVGAADHRRAAGGDRRPDGGEARRLAVGHFGKRGRVDEQIDRLACRQFVAQPGPDRRRGDERQIDQRHIDRVIAAAGFNERVAAEREIATGLIVVAGQRRGRRRQQMLGKRPLIQIARIAHPPHEQLAIENAGAQGQKVGHEIGRWRPDAQGRKRRRIGRRHRRKQRRDNLGPPMQPAHEVAAIARRTALEIAGEGLLDHRRHDDQLARERFRGEFGRPPSGHLADRRDQRRVPRRRPTGQQTFGIVPVEIRGKIVEAAAGKQHDQFVELHSAMEIGEESGSRRGIEGMRRRPPAAGHSTIPARALRVELRYRVAAVRRARHVSSAERVPLLASRRGGRCPGTNSFGGWQAVRSAGCPEHCLAAAVAI